MSKTTVTVEYILTFFGSKIAQYDARLCAKGDRNLYRLGLLLEALGKVRADLAPILASEISDVVAANVRTAMGRHFIVETMGGTVKPRGGIPPVSQTLRALEKAAAGVRVKITDQTGARTHVG